MKTSVAEFVGCSIGIHNNLANELLEELYFHKDENGKYYTAITSLPN